jgi:hypothetical protein
MTKIKLLGATIILSATFALPALAQDGRATHLRRVHNELSGQIQTSPRAQTSGRIENAGPSESDPSRIGGADADFHPASS